MSVTHTTVAQFANYTTKADFTEVEEIVGYVAAVFEKGYKDAVIGDLAENFITHKQLKKGFGSFLAAMRGDYADLYREALVQQGAKTSQVFTRNKFMSVVTAYQSKAAEDEYQKRVRQHKIDEKAAKIQVSSDGLKIEPVFTSVQVVYGNKKRKMEEAHTGDIEKIDIKRRQKIVEHKMKMDALDEEFDFVTGFEPPSNQELARMCFVEKQSSSDPYGTNVRTQERLDECLEEFSSMIIRRERIKYAMAPDRRGKLKEVALDILRDFRSSYETKKAERLTTDLEDAGIEIPDSYKEEIPGDRDTDGRDNEQEGEDDDNADD
jgi:hypothetical protein